MSAPTGRPLAAQLAAIAHHFALGDVLDFERAPGTNQNYLVTTTKGDYLIKIVVNTSLEDVLSGQPFLQRLEEEGFTAAAYYLKAPNGQASYQSADCDAVALLRLPGSAPELSSAVNDAVGRHLARLHGISSAGLPPKRHWLDHQYLPNALESAIRLHGADRLTATRAVFASLSAFQPETFPQAIIHGDLDTSNVLFDGERLVAFIDWQEVGVGAALLDFAQTAMGFAFVDTEADVNRWAVFDPGLYSAFYSGYTSLRPFTPQELAHLSDALKYVALTQVAWSMNAWGQYHPNEEMIETRLLYWMYGIDTLTLPVL